MHKEYCICDLDYIDALDVDNVDCLEALLLAQLQLSLRSHGHHMGGGVANGGHLLGLIAFARKIARVLLSLSLLCCILFLSFYLGNNYDTASDHPHSTATTIETSLVNSNNLSTTTTSIAINNSSATANNNRSAETYSI